MYRAPLRKQERVRVKIFVQVFLHKVFQTPYVYMLYILSMHPSLHGLNVRWCVIIMFLCALHVFLCVLASRLVRARTRALLRGNSKY